MADISHLELDRVGHSELLDSLSDPDEDCSYQVENSADLRSKSAVPPGEFRKYDVLFYCDEEDESPAEDSKIPVADVHDAHDSESHSTQSASQSHTRSERSLSAERSGATLAENSSRRSGGPDLGGSMQSWTGIGKGLPGGVGRGISAGLGMARLQPASSNGSLLGPETSNDRGGIGRNGGSAVAGHAASSIMGTATSKSSHEGSVHADLGAAAAGLAELDLTVEVPDVRKTGMSLTVRPPTSALARCPVLKAALRCGHSGPSCVHQPCLMCHLHPARELYVSASSIVMLSAEADKHLSRNAYGYTFHVRTTLYIPSHTQELDVVSNTLFRKSSTCVPPCRTGNLVHVTLLLLPLWIVHRSNPLRPRRGILSTACSFWCSPFRH